MRGLLRVNVVLLALLILGTVLAFPSLPEKLPSGLDLQGAGREWRHTTPLAWAAFPLLGASVVGLLIWMTLWLIPRKPGAINIPDKERLLELPRERQQPVIRLVQALMLAVSAGILLLFGGIQLGVYLAALQRPSMTLMLATLLVGLLSPLVGLAVFLPRISDEIDLQRSQMGPARRSHAST